MTVGDRSVEAAPWYSSLLRCPDCLRGLRPAAAGTLTCAGCAYVATPGLPLVLMPRQPRREPLMLARRIVDVQQDLERLAVSPPGRTYVGPRAMRDSSELLSVLPARQGNEPSATVLDLGCGPRDQAACFEHLGYRYVGLDYASAAADVRADAHFLPFASAAFSCVFSYAVLEHLYNPFLALSEAARVLEPGGVLLGTVSQGEPFHASFFHHTSWGLLSAVAQTPGLRAARVWASGSDTLASLACMGRYPRAIRGLLWVTDRLCRAAPWLAPRRMGWPARERELDRLHRAGSVCFLVVKDGSGPGPEAA